MKKARKVEIEETISSEQYKDYYNHGLNSCLWHIGHRDISSFELRTKLYNKGYPKSTTKIINEDSSVEDVNIVDELIKYLIDSSYVRDEDYVDSLIRSLFHSGKSLTHVKNKLFSKDIPEDFYLPLLEAIEYDDSAGLAREAEKIMRESSYQKLDMYKQKQKLIRRLVAKGFNYEDIFEWVDNNG